MKRNRSAKKRVTWQRVLVWAVSLYAVAWVMYVIKSAAGINTDILGPGTSVDQYFVGSEPTWKALQAWWKGRSPKPVAASKKK